MKVTGASFSSDKKLARCEQQYSYRYDQGLKRRIKKIGLYRGDWIHQLKEAHFKGKDWEKVFKELKKKLWNPLFDEEKEDYGEDFPEATRDLMGHYIEYWEHENKNWKIIQVEGDYEKMTKSGFPIRWKSDLVIKEDGLTVLVESKNLKKMPDASERILAVQVNAYAYLLSKVGIKIDRILWDYICTTPVTAPQILKDGSLSKRKIETDQRTYLRVMKEAKIQPQGEEVIGVENFLKTLPETRSLLRVRNSVNMKVGEMFVRQWVERAKRAKLITIPLRTFTRDCSWSCDYYELCQADMIGKPDRRAIINKDFVTHIKKAG